MSIKLVEKINTLKRSKKAIILAHYYQRPEVQEVADVVGDSYFLSKVAKESPENFIIFCGVKFMAESAKILSPEKTVVLPVLDAGCPMADMADEDGVLHWKKKHPDASIVAYINSSTEVKALCDVCVTSSSANKIINNLGSDEILFLPDKNLGSYLAEQFPEKKFILWNGFCITHKKVNPISISNIRVKLPNIQVLVHPECERSVRDQANYIGSTSGIIEYATQHNSQDFLIVTEEGVLHELKKRNPYKNFYVPERTMTCINMKKITLEDVYQALLNNKYEIHLNESLRLKALRSLENMHALSR